MRCWSITLEINRARNRFLPATYLTGRWRRRARNQNDNNKNTSERKSKEIFRNPRSVCGAIAPRRDVCTGISGARRRMVHLRREGLNHPLSRWHFRGWSADFIVFRTSLYTRVRHFFSTLRWLHRGPDKESWYLERHSEIRFFHPAFVSFSNHNPLIFPRSTYHLPTIYLRNFLLRLTSKSQCYITNILFTLTMLK